MSAAGSNSTCMDSTPLVQLRMDTNDPYNGMESDFEDPEVPIEEIQLGIWHRESDEDLRSMNETPHLHTEDGETVQLMEYRFDSLKADLCRIAKIGSKSASMFAKMKSRLADLEVEFCDMGAPLTSEEAPLQQGEATNSPPNKIPKFFDPVDSQCKGRKKKPTRFLPPAEANVKKRRTCSFCNQQAGHNARTCPNRGNISSKGKKVESEEEDDDIEEELSD